MSSSQMSAILIVTITRVFLVKINYVIMSTSVINAALSIHNIDKIRMKPSLNTQSCIKGLLVVRDFYFWAVWAARPVHKKKVKGRL